MLEIECIAHRGFWEDPTQKNSRASFERAFRAGFGVETDLRDHLGKVVISHDPPGASGPPELTFADFLTLYRDLGGQGMLALNIKADGLADDIKKELQRHEIEHYFAFDMSIPDMLGYARVGMNIYSRQSELETPVVLSADSGYGVVGTKGIWLDSFAPIWYSPSLVLEHLAQGLDVCLVSPELHRREHTPWWKQIQSFLGQADVNTDQRFGKLMLCTDYPSEFAKKL